MWSFVVASAFAGTPPLEPPDRLYEIEGKELCLPSGLRIRYYHEPSHPTVTWTTVIGSGGAEDPAGLEGVAHMVEHLWFLNTSFGGDIWSIQAQLGAELNGATTPDDTSYPTVAPARSLEALIKLESLRLMDPLHGVTEPVFEVERGVIQAERRWRYGSSAGTGYLALLEHVFPEGHRYHRPVIGTPESIGAMTLADAQAYAGEHYRAGNTSWTVTAPQTFREFRALLQAHLPTELREGSGAPCRVAPAAEPPLPSKAPRETIRVEGPVSGPRTYVAWSLPGGFGESEVALRAAVRMLDRVWPGDRCALQPMAKGSLAYCVKEADEGLVSGRKKRDTELESWLSDVSYVFDTKVAARLYADAIDEEAKWLLDQVEGFTAEHPDAASFHHRGSNAWLAHQANNTQLPKLMRFDLELAKWFSNQRALRLLVVPVPPERRAEGGADHGSARAERAAVSVERELPSRVEEPVDLSKLRRETLSNGLEVWVLPFGDNGFARSRLVLRGGHAMAPSRAIHEVRDRIATSFEALFTEQLTMRNAPLIIGGGWTQDWSSTTTELGIRSPSSRLDSQLYLLRERIDRMQVRGDWRRQVVKDMREHAEDSWTHPRTWADRARQEHLHGPTPEWEPTWGQSLKKVKLGEVRAWNRRLLQPDRGVLIVTGDVDPDLALDEARVRFGTWQTRSDPVGDPVAPNHSVGPRRVLVLQDSLRQDAHIELSCPTVAFEVDQGPAMDLLASIVERRAHRRLRAQMGATYGASTWATGLGLPDAALHVEVDVPTALSGAASSVLLESLAAIGSGELEAEELRAEQAAMLRRTSLEARDARQVEARLVHAVRSGYGLPWIEDRAARLAELEVSDLQAVIAPCPGHEIITVVGASDEIVASLEEAGLAPERFDWAGPARAALE